MSFLIVSLIISYSYFVCFNRKFLTNIAFNKQQKYQRSSQDKYFIYFFKIFFYIFNYEKEKKIIKLNINFEGLTLEDI